ncbi:hypothetical protein H310_13932 [Aphanomyces invadans]|uniref:RRM domain-containing protein n=1 Tax=Aphanomyces invadans TaxID=157072 RepID=A0A024TC23_9STRA|nr:hypothetical protein H310_13932 [Aphanomyces invadans]ETV91549.1 hypothetical protein H310_13932 [Aphanomyces invadans]|eukprot:XP_008879817.1 hypothetical protein H310_13932 [Aphanomyces invadans]
MHHALSTLVQRAAARSLLRPSQLTRPLGCMRLSSLTSAPEPPYRVYVGNLSYRVTEGDLASIFSNCGNIVHVNIVKNSVTLQSKGFGFVEFDAPECVDEALRVGGTVAAGRLLVVKPATPSPADTFAKHIPPPSSPPSLGPNPSKVYVGNLTFTKNEADIAELFHACGPIKHLNLVREADTGRSRGFGFVEFESPSCAQVALQLHGATIDGRTLIVKETLLPHTPVVTHVPDTVYVSRLPENVLESDLRDMFSHCGTIDSVRISHSPDFSQTFAHIKFASVDSVEPAMQLTGADFDGEVVVVQKAMRRTSKP